MRKQRTYEGQLALLDVPQAPPIRFAGEAPVPAGVIARRQQHEQAKRGEQRTKARAITEKKVEQVERNADPEWMNKALACVMTVALANAHFTSDDVWDAISTAKIEAPREPSALGPVMRRASKEGWCKSTGTNRASTRPSRHCCLLRVWVSCIAGGESNNQS